jgi:putative ABC transport system substrate-binding protein
MRRREFISLLGSAAAWPFAAHAQQTVKVTRIGFLGYSNPQSIASYVDALRAGLRDLGHIEGKNIAIEHRWAEHNDRLIDVALELVRLNVDLIVTWGTPGTRAAKQATTMVPIVMAISGDAVATGIVPSLARPGGNVTGSTIFNPELCAKRLEILKELLPNTERVGILLNPDNPVSGNNLDARQRWRAAACRRGSRARWRPNQAPASAQRHPQHVTPHTMPLAAAGDRRSAVGGGLLGERRRGIIISLHR